MATEKLGIKIEKNPPESKLAQLGVRSWPKTIANKLADGVARQASSHGRMMPKRLAICCKGKVKVSPAGSTDYVEISAGDLVEFPKGMSCTWDVSVAVDKHYSFS